MNAKRWVVVMVVLASMAALGLTSAYAQGGPGMGYGAGGAAGAAGASAGQGAGYQGGRDSSGAPAGVGGGLRLNQIPVSTIELPQDIVDLMIAGWMDEQHAYAVYGGVIDQLGAVRPFVNIQRSEAQHIAAWELLLDRHGIAIPETPQFELPQVAAVSEACSVGAEAEVANFDLYDTMMAAFAPYPDLLNVAQTLRDASEFNHLPAFENCAIP